MGVWRNGLLIGLLALTACGGMAGSPGGDPLNGQKLFSGQITIAGGAPACATCHAVTPDTPAEIGPNLSNIGNRAAARVPGQLAPEYLRTSIVDPDAYLADNFQEGIMYGGYRQVLTQQQLNDVVAYLLELKSGYDG